MRRQERIRRGQARRPTTGPVRPIPRRPASDTSRAAEILKRIERVLEQR